MIICHACNKEITNCRSVGVRDRCSSCGADLHCCANCRFYNPSASKQCRETIADLVRDKKKKNYCDFFVIAEEKLTSDTSNSSVIQARKALDDLFKK